MAYVPINLAVLQYAVPSPSSTDDGGYGVLKAYAVGTSTMQQMATDETGGTLVNSIQLDSNGFPSYGGNIIMPHIDDGADYKVALYANQDAADADTPSLFSHDNLTPVPTQGSLTTNDATNNGVTNVVTHTHTTSGTPAAGIGTGVALAAETAAGNNETGVVLAGVTTDVTPASEDFDLSIRVMIGGAAAAEVAKFTSGGDLVFALANPSVLGADADGAITVSGSTTGDLGGNAVFYSESHSTKAGDIELRNTTTVVGKYDNSQGNWAWEKSFLVKEQAAASSDVAGYGQFWVKDDAPNTAWFTDDAGTDFQLATLAGTEALTNKTVSGTLLNVADTIYPISDGGSVDIDPANGRIQTWTLGANRTPTATSFANGQSVTLFVNDGTAYDITWTSISVTWLNNGGTKPTLAASGYTAITLMKIGGTVYGFLAGNQT